MEALRNSPWIAPDFTKLVTGIGNPGGPWPGTRPVVFDTVAEALVASDFGGVIEPVPSPVDGHIFATGIAQVWNSETGTLTSANLPDGGIMDFPWGVSGETVAFGVPRPQRDGGTSTLLCPPVIEYPPFDDRMLFRIAPAEGAELLDLPAGAPVATLPNGTQVELEDTMPPNESSDSAHGIVPGSGKVFVHVRASEGRSGWIDQLGLEWAVGIPLETRGPA
jgi:hypothetical protein